MCSQTIITPRKNLETLNTRVWGKISRVRRKIWLQLFACGSVPCVLVQWYMHYLVLFFSFKLGNEKDYVILSLVRSLPKCDIEFNPSKTWLSENVRFVMDENQVNVALTRAKQGLVIIG